jgi:hypothetical protein
MLRPREDVGFKNYHSEGVRAWLWQVYDRMGRLLTFGSVARRETAISSIRRAVLRFGNKVP